MSLQAFLNKDKREKRNKIVEFVASEDFKDADGKVVPFQIKPISFSTFSTIREKCSIIEIKDKRTVKRTNEGAVTLATCAKAVVYPDLKSAELQDYYGVMTEVDLIDAMLDFDELQNLASKILEISGLNKDINEVKEEAKN